MNYFCELIATMRKAKARKFKYRHVRKFLMLETNVIKKRNQNTFLNDISL
jgi:hypothetical protein